MTEVDRKNWFLGEIERQRDRGIERQRDRGIEEQREKEAGVIET